VLRESSKSRFYARGLDECKSLMRHAVLPADRPLFAARCISTLGSSPRGGARALGHQRQLVEVVSVRHVCQFPRGNEMRRGLCR
jgi:hypothetical protein